MEKLPRVSVKFVGRPAAIDLLSLGSAARLTGMRTARLRELAELGYAPHVQIDDGPLLFQKKVIKEWVLDNLVKITHGVPLPRVDVLHFDREAAKPRDIPSALFRVRPLIASPPTPQACGPGVYFLCCRDDVVYVGQSVEVYARAAQHVATKEYDRWYWIPLPVAELDSSERGFIYALRPKYNHNSLGRLAAPGGTGDGSVARFLAEVGEAQT